MRLTALACLLGTVAGCHRFVAPEERINAAVPLAGEVLEARQAFAEQARVLGFDTAPVDAAFRDRLRARARECAHDYTPSWFDSEDEVRSRLGDDTCFGEADRALARWIGLRHAGLLLAAPPLRPVPAEAVSGLVASERISEGSFPRNAGVAVLHTTAWHELFDLGSGERLRKIPRGRRSFIVDISDNGRLLSLNQDQSTVVLDVEHGRPLLRLDDVVDQRLFWLGQAGAVYLREGQRTPLFVDLMGGRETPIPTPLRQLGAVAPTPERDRYVLLGFTRHASIDLHRDARGWTATLAREAGPAQAVGHWPRRNLSADGRLFIGQQNGPVLFDLRSLQIRKPELAPLMLSLTVPTPDPDIAYLFGHYRTAGDVEHQALLYSIGQHTLAPARIGKRVSSTVRYLPSIRRNALLDRSTLILLDRLEAAEAPVPANAYLSRLPVVAEPVNDPGDGDAALEAWNAAVQAQEKR
jgi:hypothetical protein